MSEFVAYSVEVTEEDIAKGKEDDCEHCAVALACQRTIHPFVHVYGLRCSIYRYYNDGWLGQFSLPEHAVMWINDFDRGVVGKPFTFEVSVPKVEGLR